MCVRKRERERERDSLMVLMFVFGFIQQQKTLCVKTTKISDVNY